MNFVNNNPYNASEKGLTTVEIVVSVALLSAFYAAIMTMSSFISSASRPSEIRPALDQVITSDIETIRNNSWAYLYHTGSGNNCYLTDPDCPPNKNKSLDDLRSICSNLNFKFLRSFNLPKISLSRSSHSIFRDNSELTLSRKISYNISLPIPLRSYEKNSIRLDYFLQSSNRDLLEQFSDLSNIRNTSMLVRTYTFTPTAHSFCSGSSIF